MKACNTGADILIWSLQNKLHWQLYYHLIWNPYQSFKLFWIKISVSPKILQFICGVVKFQVIEIEIEIVNFDKS